MRVVVIGFDGSADARRALAWAEALSAGESDVLLHLVQALGTPTLRGPVTAEELANLLAEHEQSSRSALEEEVARLTSNGLHAEAVVRRWFPAETLIEHAEQVAAQLVVLGTHGAGRARFLLGSTTSEVVRGAHSPILVARGSRLPVSPRKVLLALDGSIHSARAARVAARWSPQAALCATQVEGGADILSPEELSEVIAGLSLNGRAVTVRRLRGDPAQQILRLVESEEIDLIALGTRGLGPLVELLLGSVTEKLLQLAPCPVLISR